MVYFVLRSCCPEEIIYLPNTSARQKLQARFHYFHHCLIGQEISTQKLSQCHCDRPRSRSLHGRQSLLKKNRRFDGVERQSKNCQHNLVLHCKFCVNYCILRCSSVRFFSIKK